MAFKPTIFKPTTHKHQVISLMLLLLAIGLMPFTIAQNLYQQDSLQFQLTVQEAFTLEPTAPQGEVKEAQADILLFPKNSFRQQLLDIQTSGDVLNDKVHYEWRDGQLGRKTFGYQAIVETKNARQAVTKKVLFPLSERNGEERYTFPSKKIDSDNPAIIAQAQQLSAGEDDVFKIAFTVAHWVTENVRYDLNDLTTNVAQKASWVLENKQGVCDEMTSLFIAMMRSLGVPARFVSGISYTEHPDVVQALGTNWASHGWAEVYFPSIGWVPFDLTFDEYGYIDVTHITLRESTDPDQPATTFQWLAEDVHLQTEPLDTDVVVQKKGRFVPEEIELAMELLAEEVDLGSYNVIKGVLKNTADYYVATILHLAVPEQLELFDTGRRTFLLMPREVKETSWIVKVQDNLDPGFIYQFPTIVYSEKNISYTDTFQARKGATFFSQEEIASLVVKDEDKSYSRKLALDCSSPQEISLATSATLRCTLKNNGNQDLKDLRFCLEEKCTTVILHQGEETELQRDLSTDTAGWQKVAILVQNVLVEKRSVIQYRVLDAPKIVISVQKPEEVLFGVSVPLTLQLKKSSFSIPQNIVIILQGMGIEQRWEVTNLQQDEELTASFDGRRLAGTNGFTLTASWKDSAEKEFSTEQAFVVQGKADSLGDSLRMIINRILHLVAK